MTSQLLLSAHLCVAIAQLLLSVTLLRAQRPLERVLGLWYALVAVSITTGALWLDLHRGAYAHLVWPWLYLGVTVCYCAGVEWWVHRATQHVSAQDRGER